ncbi:aminotransferase-like domain-containing protein [Lysobacter sp. TAB13]|uniref:aminotransferase-like domain-containing protein n=1 Tax=Lysobacter sp. TAB13 TaxID=3233065 RepID=UPI003F9814D4
MELAERLYRIESFGTPQIFKALQRPDMISFAGGVPDGELFDVEGIQESTNRVLTDTPLAALQYGLALGLPALRRELACYMDVREITIDPDRLLVTSGGQQALDLAGKVLLTPGDRVLVETPTFVAAIECFRLHGAEVIGLPGDHDGVDIEALEAQLIRHQPKLVYLVPSFGNPSGRTLSLERRLKVLELAERHGAFVVEDDPYSELYFAAPPPLSLLALAQRHGLAADRVVYCGTLSKVLSPGLRVGWLATTKPELLDAAEKCKLLSDTHSNALSQAVAADYLGRGRLAPMLVQSRRIYAERASAMADAMETNLGGDVTFQRPAGGLFLWSRLTDADAHRADADRLSLRAHDHAVAILPGSLFYPDKPDKATFRLCFASVGRDRIREGIARLRGALAA